MPTFLDDKSTSKARVGIPRAEWPQGIDLKYEARRGRRRLYPVTITYAALCTGLMVWAAHRALAVAAAGAFCGVFAWTLLEYLTHRYVLHGIFPNGRTSWQRFLHKRFDGLHWFHHLRPWDGAHINGAIHDTAIFVALFVALALWSGTPFALAFVAALVTSYVAEEWVHHSVHFYRFKNPYFQYIRRHHLYHHSPRGDDIAFGLTSGLWDAVCGTRIPVADRQLLYGPRGGRVNSERPVAPVHGKSAPHSFA